MDNLRSAIDVLFCKTNPEYVIQQFLQWDSQDLTEKIPQGKFVDLSETLENGRTKDELKSIYKIAVNEWNTPPETFGKRATDQQNIFYTLVTFTREILLEMSEKPICEFSQLLRWRELSFKLGEDMLTTAFFASKDLAGKRERHYFSWPTTIATNNYHLREILEKGVTDLHFHLLGSSLNFELTWLSLMNDIIDRKKDFSKIKNSKMPDANLWFEENQLSLYGLCIKACAIRQLLFRIIIKEINETTIIDEKSYTNKLFNLYLQILQCRTEESLQMYIHELQEENKFLKYTYGKRYGNQVVDYAIRSTFSEKNYDTDSYHNTILYGERWLLYKMFYIIFSGRGYQASFKPFFYAYLIIKIRLRKELIQLNNYPGFHNFQDYQGRKTIFIKQNSIYRKLLVNLAINNVAQGKHVKYLEARITPEPSLNLNIQRIRELDKIVASKDFKSPRTPEKPVNEFHYYYIYHFIKRNMGDNYNNTYEAVGLVTPRNHMLRKYVKEQAMAINLMRRHISDAKERVVGIDAASSEIGYRPEIFAHAFRYLKKYSCELENHFLESSSLGALGCTFHVGEDFLDIADGLRAIDETIKYLNFRRSDRLGHCLALGVEAKKYYHEKKYQIIMPKQDHLDNVAWLIMQIKIYNLPTPQSLIQELHMRYWELFHDIYHQEIEEHMLQSTPPEIYYLGWLLRSDDPLLYLDPEILSDPDNYNPITYWERCSLNRFSEAFKIARKNPIARKLYRLYHFSYQVKNTGKTEQEYKVNEEYITLIANIQEAVKFNLAKQHIAIESNPTSNKLIGAYKLYADHPLKRFFNLGLTFDHKELEKCPQLSVSLNTDDLGIFSTNIENEYALMAIAMEKEMDIHKKGYCSRMIYDWLNRIRLMGFEQRFKRP